MLTFSSSIFVYLFTNKSSLFVEDFTLKPDVQQTLGAGLVFTCGQNDVGQLGLGTDIDERSRPTLVKGLENIVDICAGGMHTLCIDKDGKVFTKIVSPMYILFCLSNWSNVSQVYSWGCNDDSALGRETVDEETAVVPGTVNIDEKVVQITAGDSHSAALTESGKVYAWGSFRVCVI